MNALIAICRADAVAQSGLLSYGPRRFFVSLCVLFQLCGILLPHSAFAAREDPMLQSRVKAAFLYNFAKFIDWPAEVFSSPEEPFRICLFGETQLRDVLDEMVGKGVKGRNVVVEELDVGASSELLKSCQIVFCGWAERSSYNDLLSRLGPASVLLVSDVPGQGTISFRVRGERVTFDVNLKWARSIGLQVSARLLMVAADVRQ